MIENIIWPEGTTEEQKSYMRDFIERQVREKEYVYMMYKPDCGCEYYSPVLLDRFPMSHKIFTKCEDCKKGIYTEQVYPPEFYIPLIDKIYLLEDFPDMHIGEGYQKQFLEMYKLVAEKLNILDNEEDRKRLFHEIMDMAYLPEWGKV